MQKIKQLKGPALLLIVTLVWGVAFVAQSEGAKSIGAFTFIGIRSMLAALLLLLVIGVRALIALGNKKRANGREGEAPEKPALKKSLVAGLLCGAALFVAANLQQFGIQSYPPEVASSGRAGFITSIYVIFIAVFSWIKGRRFSLKVLLSVLVCMGGMYLLCLSGGVKKLYLGDLLVFLCAVTFSVHIILIDHFSQCDGIVVSCVQFLFSGALSLVCMAIFEKPQLSVILSGWLPLVYSGFLSSGIGYTLQILGQKHTKPQTAAIILSLESVFAALAGWVILHEVLGVAELIGCALVFISVIMAQLPDRWFSRKKTPPDEGTPQAPPEAENREDA